MNKTVAILSSLVCLFFFSDIVLSATVVSEHTHVDSKSVITATTPDNSFGIQSPFLYHQSKTGNKSAGWKWMPGHKLSYKNVVDTPGFITFRALPGYSAPAPANSLYILYARLLI